MGYKDNYMGDTPRGGGSSDVFPSNQFGSFEQTLFLGCTIIEFSVTVGWNQQVSELTVQLVEDDQPAPASSYKVYYDRACERQTTQNADPGFFSFRGTSPTLGSAVYFRVGNFEFAGILSSWTQDSSTTGNPTYTVKVIDPRQILENTQLIIGDYAGGIRGDLYNVLNVYGFMEWFYGYQCASYDIGGVSFGTLSYAYGGSDTNVNGMPVSRILIGLKLLTSAIPREIFASIRDAYGYSYSPHGRLVYRGPRSFGADGYGILPADSRGMHYYILDLSEVPVPPNYIRRRATSMSVMELLNGLADELGFDYYIELIIVKSGGLQKFIKIRTISRVRQPSIGFIDSFIGDCENNKTLLASTRNKGQELRNEETATLVIGGKQQSIYQADSYIRQFMGFNSDGSVVEPLVDGEGWGYFSIETAALNASLITISLPSTIIVTEKELLAASKKQETWWEYAIVAGTDSIQEFSDDVKKPNIMNLIDGLTGAGENLARDTKHVSDNSALVEYSNTDVYEDIKKVYNFIHTLFSEFYGKKFIVNIPFTCWFIDTEAATYTGEAKIQYTDIPSDGGWAWTSTVIDLQHPELTTLFTLDDNRLGCFLKFSSVDQLDFSLLNSDEYYYDGYNLYVKGQVYDKLVFLTGSTDPMVIVEISNMLHDREDGLNNFGMNMRGFAMIVTAAGLSDSKINEIAQKIGGLEIKHYHASYAAKYPAKVAVPLKNTVRTYGPWASTSSSLVAGTVRIEYDEGLVPWEYGNGALMSVAGQYRANANLTYMQVGEMGQITVLGYPTIPLGAELGARGYYLDGNNIGPALIEYRTAYSKSTYICTYNGVTYTCASRAIPAVAGVSFGQGLYGPNITNINVEVGPRGIQTTYTLRTFTPKFGRFEKYNADRIKNLGNNLLQHNKRLWNLTNQKTTQQNTKSLNQFISYTKNLEEKADRLNDPKSSQEVLIGQITTHPTNTDLYRSSVALYGLTESQHELTYHTGKAVTSLDAFFRPVSIDGLWELPRYASYDASGHVAQSWGATPPLDLDGEESYNLEISNEYENPYSNPATSEESFSVTKRSDTWEHGHDIDIVTRERDGGLPDDTLVMPIAGAAQGKDADWQDDYSILALKGPIVYQSWGYDIDGKPIPNKVDTFENASVGYFEKTELQDKFMDNFLQKSPAWPVGPIDLRFDRNRGVWVSPPAHRLVSAKLTEDLKEFSSASARLTCRPILYDADGVEYDAGNIEDSKKMTFTVWDIVGIKKWESGQDIVAYYNPATDAYWMMPMGGMNTGISTDFCLVWDVYCKENELWGELLHLEFRSGLLMSTGDCELD